MTGSIKMYPIEVDEEVYNFLKNHAEPFIDVTPNVVLRRFLPLKSERVESKSKDIREVLPHFPESVPHALAEILQVIILVKAEGRNRIEATHTVADIRGISTQAVIDKYCRQLGKKAYEIDDLLSNSNIGELKTLLISRFPNHSKVVEESFSKIKI